MTTEQITLLHTISRVPHTYEAGYAKRLLADPHYGKLLVEWDSEKAEVLGRSTVGGEIVDDNGDPVRVPVKEVAEVVKAQEVASAASEVVSKAAAAKRTTTPIKKD